MKVLGWAVGVSSPNLIDFGGGGTCIVCGVKNICFDTDILKIYK